MESWEVAGAVVSSLQGLAGLHLGSGQWRSPVSCNVCGYSGQCSDQESGRVEVEVVGIPAPRRREENSKQAPQHRPGGSTLTTSLTV